MLDFLHRHRHDVDDNRERLPTVKPADCLGEGCQYFTGQPCESRMELLEASGDSGGVDAGPYVDDASYALYGQVCTGGAGHVVVDLLASSPNGHADACELIGRMGAIAPRRIVLNPRH